MKIKHENGMVTFLMRAGKDMVKNQMPIEYAQSIVDKSEAVTEKDGQIVVDNTFFFPAVVPKRKKQTEVDV